jgi:hypothetical protein
MNAHKGAGLVFSDAILVDENLQRLGPTLWQTVRLNPIRQRKLRTGHAVDVLAKANYVTGATLAFCSKYRDVILPISPKWIHDYWIASIIGCYSPLIAIPEPLIMYRQHPENLIGQSAELKPIVGSESDIFRLHRERYQLLHERLLDLQARLMQIDDLPNKDALSARLQNRMTHVLARATLPDRRLARLPIIVQELLSGHYTRYSRRALWSALRDIVAT